MTGRQALAAQLAAQMSQQLTARLEAADRKAAAAGTNRPRQLTAAAAEAIDDLTRSLTAPKRTPGELERELSRAGAARAALESLSYSRP